MFICRTRSIKNPHGRSVVVAPKVASHDRTGPAPVRPLGILLVLLVATVTLSGCIWVEVSRDGPLELDAPQGGSGDAYVRAVVRFESDTGPLVSGAKIGARPTDATDGSRDIILRTDDQGRARFGLQPDAAYHFGAQLEPHTPATEAATYVDEWGTTEEYALDVMTGRDGETRDILIVLYARHKTLQVDLAWHEPVTLNGAPGPITPSRGVTYVFTDPAFGDTRVSEAYGARISDATVVARWDNTPTQYADFGVVLRGGEGGHFKDDVNEMAAAGTVSETLRLDQGGLEAAGIRGPGALQVGIGTDQLVVAPQGIQANVTLDAWFKTDVAEGSALEPLLVVLGTVLVLALARRRE